MRKYFDTKYFEITTAHLKLIEKMYVSWEDCEFGAPAIDCKRPYGNSYVIGDIAEILEIKPDVVDAVNGDEDFSNELQEKLTKLHTETELVLQICLSNLKFETGFYYKENPYDDKSWKKMSDNADLEYLKIRDTSTLQITKEDFKQ